MVMAKQIIHLNEKTLKSIIRETLNEMTNAEFQQNGDSIPKLGHTDRAFAPGDILCRMMQRTAVDADGNRIIGTGGRSQQVRNLYFNTIKDIEGGMLVLDDGSKVPPTHPSIRATDTWYRVFQSTGLPDAIGLTFDYEMIDGQLWVVMDFRGTASNHTKTRFNYNEVKNAPEGQPIKGIKMDANPELAKSGFWIAPGTTKVNKSKNPLEGQVEIPREFINFRMLSGMNSGAELFDSWNFDKAKEICEKFPWLAEKPTDWSKPIIKGNKQYANQRMKQSKCTPSTFKF
jgi:hypothetical protein